MLQDASWSIDTGKHLSQVEFDNHILRTLLHFKRLGIRHIHKEIKLQKAVNGMDMILCKTDLIIVRRHTYKCNTFSDVDFEAFSQSACVRLWYSQFQ